MGLRPLSYFSKIAVPSVLQHVTGPPFIKTSSSLEQVMGQLSCLCRAISSTLHDRQQETSIRQKTAKRSQAVVPFSDQQGRGALVSKLYPSQPVIALRGTAKFGSTLKVTTITITDA